MTSMTSKTAAGVAFPETGPPPGEHQLSRVIRVVGQDGDIRT